MTGKISIGEIREIDSYDPYTGKEVRVKIMILEIFLSSDVWMVKCALNETNQEINIPLDDLTYQKRIEPDYSSLIQIRKRIERIDRQIVGFLAKRLELVAIAAEIKKDLGRTVEDREQEERVKEHIKSLASKFFLDFNDLWVIFQEIIKWSKCVQRNKR